MTNTAFSLTSEIALLTTLASCASASAVVPNGSSSVLAERFHPLVLLRGGADGDKESKDNKKRKKKKKRKEASTEKTSAPSPETAAPSTSPIVHDVLRHRGDFYKVLGLEKSQRPSDRDIQKAYRKRCLQTHPDKTNGDRRAFDLVSEAYDVLSDGQKRAQYDRYGARSLNYGINGAPGSAEDLFRSFFGGRFPSSAPRNQSLRYQLQVSLEDLYKGVQQDIVIATQTSQQKSVHVHVPRGALHGQRIVLSGEMDFGDQDTPPGDIIFILQQQSHHTFTRNAYDLAMRVKVSLAEALRGSLRREVVHLDGRKLEFECRADGASILHTNDVYVLKGEGMPKDEQGTEFGDLYVQYEVEPLQASNTARLTPGERSQLCNLLEKLEDSSTDAFVNSEDDNSGVLRLTKASPADFGRASGTPPQPEDEYVRTEEESFSPFGKERFYWSSSGTNPFFGGRSSFDDDDGSNVQCQQM